MSKSRCAKAIFADDGAVEDAEDAALPGERPCLEVRAGGELRHVAQALRSDGAERAAALAEDQKGMAARSFGRALAIRKLVEHTARNR